MGIFRKKIDEQATASFFVMAYGKIFSEDEQTKRIDQLCRIKETFPLLDGVKQQTFDEHLNAVNLAWLSIAWSKYFFKKGVDIVDGVDFMAKLQPALEKEVPELKQYDALSEMYSQAFGSSYTDGDTAMAMVFVDRMMDDFDKKAEQYPEDIRQIVLFFSAQFVSIFKSCQAGLKSYHLVH